MQSRGRLINLYSLPLKWSFKKNGGGRKAKVAAKLASKRQSDPDIDTSIRSRDRHGSESGSSTGAGERDRIGLNDSLRFVLFKMKSWINRISVNIILPHLRVDEHEQLKGERKVTRGKLLLSILLNGAIDLESLNMIRHWFEPPANKLRWFSVGVSMGFRVISRRFVRTMKRNFIVQLGVKPKVEWVIWFPRRRCFQIDAQLKFNFQNMKFKLGTVHHIQPNTPDSQNCTFANFASNIWNQNNYHYVTKKSANSFIRQATKFIDTKIYQFLKLMEIRNGTT